VPVSTVESGNDGGHSVRDVYDRWARYYDWNPALALVRPTREWAVDAMGLEPGDVAVDMGTGTGANLPHLRDAVGPEGRVVGIDVSPGMLDRARGRVTRRGWENVDVVGGDVLAPPLDVPADGITSGFLLVMYDEPERLIDAWVECLAEGGAIANVYAGSSDRWYGMVSNWLLSAYLRTFESVWVAPDHGGSALATITARGERARSALAGRADVSHHENRVGGLAHVDVGLFRSD
jgi:ubiquinone/menaquinone biosynthesis C-methylase UbiE